MSEGYTKLFSDIVDSSIWDEDADTCKVWVTMLALANADGFVRGSVPWLAKKARVDVNKCQQALTKFEGPDPVSRTPDEDGRRIRAVDSGWELINHSKFRARSGLSENPRRAYQREWMRKKRESQQSQQKLTVLTAASASGTVSTGGEGGVNEKVNKRFTKPSLEEVRLAAAKAGLPEREADRFWDYYDSNGWRVGKNPMKSWVGALANWKKTWEERRYSAGSGVMAPKVKTIQDKEHEEAMRRIERL